MASIRCSLVPRYLSPLRIAPGLSKISRPSVGASRVSRISTIPSRSWSSRPLSSTPASSRRRVNTLFSRLTARSYSSRTADEVMEEITEQYATAKDEFEIASEETEKVSVYAEDDRKAAREELDKLKSMFAEVTGNKSDLNGGAREEVVRRVGGRIRELDEAVKAMEEMALHQD